MIEEHKHINYNPRKNDPSARGRANYTTHLSAVHKKWKAMPEQEQQTFEDRAAQEPERLHLPQPTIEEDHALEATSPWSIGSLVYPCAPATLRKIVQEMLPDGKQWVREAYVKCREAVEPEAIARCIVQNTETPLDLNSLRRHRTADATCFQAHPGLCVCDTNATSVRSFHQSLRSALQSFHLDPATSCGDALFLFCGYSRKADADRTQRRVQDHAVAHIAADHFEIAFLADEPDRRKGLNTFTRCHCRVDDEGKFNFGCHAGLVQTEEQTLDERVGHAFSKLLRERSKYWLCFLLAYQDLDEEFHVVRVCAFVLFCFLNCFHTKLA